MAAEAGKPKLGIIAGGGTLPLRVADACTAAHRPHVLFAIQGEADAPVERQAVAVLPIGAFGAAIEQLKAQGCGEVLFVGKVGWPDFSAIKLDWGGIKLLPKLIAAKTQGDDAVLRVMGAAFEAEGMRLVGVDDVAESLVAPAGSLGALTPDETACADLAKAVAVIAALGPFNVGQGAVVCDGIVLAVEAAEGTDEMLARCARLPDSFRGTEASRRGVLVKMPKPGQERRIDLPTIGLATIEGAAAAGLAGVAIAAGGALVLDREAVAARADALGLFVYGFTKDKA